MKDDQQLILINVVVEVSGIWRNNLCYEVYRIFISGLLNIEGKAARRRRQRQELAVENVDSAKAELIVAPWQSAAPVQFVFSDPGHGNILFLEVRHQQRTRKLKHLIARQDDGRHATLRKGYGDAAGRKRSG